ncbi:alternate-type signal peptide domain-containing protein [Paramicrobacterium chengjingii]|uniref:Alternate-type signal peptide domain-containing protein n=1 Tax=Paramicrobacterium chengjingii TaxID=2769067 RepID=A0ABX6YGC9_9MICO|nr:alternate-type signal peptide domain-containing protein [Microbacterium chengjingii]QPZ37669.1 alternate-type signal peptide domain-containing protein [Microbacterium chengjingii]
MKKMTKGAIAAGIGAVLLLGGAGTLAFWSDDAALAGGTLTTGNLTLTDATATSNWVYAEGNVNAGDAVQQIVPGDTITKTMSFTINASGDNLTATLTTPSSTTVTVDGGTAPETLQMNVSAAYEIDGEAVPSAITSANDGDVVTAVVTVTFPFGDATVNGNDTQGISAALNDITVQLVQTEA